VAALRSQFLGVAKLYLPGHLNLPLKAMGQKAISQEGFRSHQVKIKGDQLSILNLE
jgi:hypothetical protein